MKVAWLFLFAFALVPCLIVAASAVAPSLGLMDQPGGRKFHQVPVPVVGGFCIFLVVTALIPFTDISPQASIHISVAGAVLVAIGLLDDARDVSASIKAIAQVCAATAVTLAANVQLNHLGR